MRKFIPLFVLAATLLSCNSEDTNTTPNTGLLQRVDFYPGTAYERHWNFNSEGLLSSITSSNNELVESFVYDSNNNVIQDIKYHLGTPTETYLITYDSNNKITNINSKSYNYSAADNRYYYSDGNETFSCELNADGLATHYSDFFDYPDDGDDIVADYTFQYVNGNMIGMFGFGTGLSEIELHFTYGAISNPLKNASLAVLKLKSLIEPQFFNTGISSNAVKETQSYASGDPETHSFGILIYPSNNIELLSQENYYSGVYQSTNTNSYYHYQ